MAHGSRSFALLAGLVMFGGVAVAPALAATITYNFTGDVDQVGAQLRPPAPPFNTSSTISGVMTVNTADGNSNNNRGSYTIESFSVTVGGYTATFPPGTSGLVEIRNVNGGDRFGATVVNPSGVQVRGFSPSLFQIDLRGPNTVFGNDALPGPGALPPSIDEFSNRTTWRLVFGAPGNSRTVSGDLTSLTAVPLPPAVILFGVGLVALIGLGAAGLRNLRLPQA
jgi:hypothetical protein